MALAAIWAAAGSNSVAEISGDARYYLALWSHPRTATAPPFTYRVLTPWLARLSGLDAFWAFAVVTILGLAVAGVLLWAVVLRDHTPHQAWLALGLFLVSPAAVYALADHYLVDPVAYAFLAGVLLLLQRDRLTLAAAVCPGPARQGTGAVCCANRSPTGRAGACLGAARHHCCRRPPSLYLVIHRTDWIASGAGREFPYFTEANLSSVVANQGGALRALLIALVVGLGPLAVAAALGWRSTAGVLRLWALLLVPIALSVVIAGDWIRMLAYSAVVLVPIAAQRDWPPAGAALALGATAVSSIGVQKLPESWLQVLAGAAIIAVYAILAPRRAFSAGQRRLLSSSR